MNQEKVFSPTIIDLSNEYRVKIEHVSEFKTSFFKEIYEQAKNHVSDIVKTNSNYREKLEEGTEGWDDVYNNIIVFEGERGKGKSSAMLSFKKALSDKNNLQSRKDFFQDTDLVDKYNFVSFDVIDPSFFNGDETLFEIIVAKLFNQFKNNLTNKNTQEKITDNEKRELISIFQKVFEDIKCQERKEVAYDGDALDALMKLSASSNLKKSFSELLEKYLNAFGVKSKTNFLVLTIDDFDLNIPGMYQMMEDIRRFLINENIVILMSCKFSQVKEATYLELYKMFFKKVKNIKALQQIVSKEEIIKKGDRYIQKLIPTNRINKLKDLGIDYYDFEVEEESRFLKPCVFLLSNLKNERNYLSDKFSNKTNISPKEIEEVESNPSVVIGENFQRTFFKFFYKERKIFICNRKNYIYGLVPNTFRDLYDIKKQMEGASLIEFVKDLLSTKLNTKIIELENNKLNTVNPFLLFYKFLFESITFINNNDLNLFNDYFFSNIKDINNIFRPTNGLGIEELDNSPYVPNSIPNSWLYSILYGIKDNNKKYDPDLDHILDLYTFLLFLINKEYSSSRKNKSRLLTPTNSMHFHIGRFNNKTENQVKRDFKHYGFLFNKNDVDINTLDSKEVAFFCINLVSEILLPSKIGVLTPYNIFRLGKDEIIEAIRIPQKCSIDLTRILQPNYNCYQELKSDYLSDQNTSKFEEWFNPTEEVTKRYVDLFYNPVFFDLFKIKLKQYSGTKTEINASLVEDIYLKSGVRQALEEINSIYPYLDLKFEELIEINPLLSIYSNHSNKIGGFLKNLYDSIKEDYEGMSSNLEEDMKFRKTFKNYLRDWENKNKTGEVAGNLEERLDKYLNNSLCTDDQRGKINDLLLYIRNGIKNRSKNDKLILSDGIINDLEIYVDMLLKLF